MSRGRSALRSRKASHPRRGGARSRNERTNAPELQRRLNDEETPFAEVVDSVRSELACLYVRDAARSLEDIAALLGYAGSRPFQRAFKR
jgi:AraC-like DNA-binding protein